MQDIENSGRAEGKVDPLALKTWDTYETFSTAKEKRVIVVEAVKDGPKFIWFLTNTCQKLSHLASQVVNGNWLLPYSEEIVFKFH